MTIVTSMTHADPLDTMRSLVRAVPRLLRVRFAHRDDTPVPPWARASWRAWRRNSALLTWMIEERRAALQ